MAGFYFGQNDQQNYKILLFLVAVNVWSLVISLDPELGIKIG